MWTWPNWALCRPQKHSPLGSENSYSQIHKTEKMVFYKIIYQMQLFVIDSLIHAIRSSAANMGLG